MDSFLLKEITILILLFLLTFIAVKKVVSKIITYFIKKSF